MINFLKKICFNIVFLRYNHESVDESDDHDTDDSSMFGSFSSCSPRYHRAYSQVSKTDSVEALDVHLRSSTSSSSLKDVASPMSPNADAASMLAIKSEQHILRSLSVTEDRTTTSRFAANRQALMNCSDSGGSNCSLLSDKTNNSGDLALKLPASLTSTPKQSLSTKEKLACPLSKSIDASSSSSSSILDVAKIHRPQSIEDGGTLKKSSFANLPKFSFSIDDSPKDSSDPSVQTPTTADSVFCKSPPPPIPPKVVVPSQAPYSPKSRTVIKSASASGLSLIIPSDQEAPSKLTTLATNQHAGLISSMSGGSNSSSRDVSPNRDLSPANSLALQLKPPIILRKGPRGFGFSLKAIRVYHGESDYFTVNHLVSQVKMNSPAFDAGLRPGDLITHINGELIQGLLHHQVSFCVLKFDSHLFRFFRYSN